MRTLNIETEKNKEVINITPQIEKILEKHPAKDGLLHLFLRHTTAALAAAYIEEDLNMIGTLEVIIPASPLAKEHTHHMGHMPAHVVGSLLGPYLAIPVKNNKLLLGTFQSIVLVELNGPQKRELVIDYQEKSKY